MRYRRVDETGAVIYLADDASRTVSTYDETGAVTSARPYTAQENADADALAPSWQIQAARATLTDTTKLATRLTRLAAYKTDPEIVAALARTNSTVISTADLNRLLKTMLRREERLTATVALLVRLVDPALLADVSDTADA